MTSKTIFATSRMAVLAAAVSAATLLGAWAPPLVGGAMVGTALKKPNASSTVRFSTWAMFRPLYRTSSVSRL